MLEVVVVLRSDPGHERKVFKLGKLISGLYCSSCGPISITDFERPHHYKVTYIQNLLQLWNGVRRSSSINFYCHSHWLQQSKSHKYLA